MREIVPVLISYDKDSEESINEEDEHLTITDVFEFIQTWCEPDPQDHPYNDDY